MAINIESRIKRIENEIKNLKATYTISGGLIKSYESASPTYEVSGVSEIILKFTPQFPQKDIVLAGILYEFYYDVTDRNNNFSSYAYIEPQDDKDYLILKVPALSGTVRVTVIGTSPGTFTRIQ